MSGDRSHRRRGERLPLLPCHLWNSLTGLSPRSLWGTDGSLHLLIGNMPLATLLNIPPRYPPLDMNLPYRSLTLLPPWHLGPQQDPNGDTLPLTRLYPHLYWKALLEGSLKNCPTWSKGMRCLFTNHWWGVCEEAFAKDSDLVWKAREDYFKTNCPHFDCETSCDLTGVFWDMVTSASLLGSQIYKIQEVWRGQDELWYANDVLKTLPKGLQFFCPVSPSESPKVMGLAGIHNPDTLHCFASVTFALGVERRAKMRGP